MATLKLGLIFSENTSATIFFWGHYHGQTAVEEKDSLVFYIWKSDSQHRFFSTVCTGWKQLCDLDAHGRCWVPYGSAIGCSSHTTDPCPITPQPWAGSGTKRMQQGWLARLVAPAKEDVCSLLTHFLLSLLFYRHNICISLSFQDYFPS